jgi:hypothetical protein
MPAKQAVAFRRNMQSRRIFFASKWADCPFVSQRKINNIWVGLYPLPVNIKEWLWCCTHTSFFLLFKDLDTKKAKK